VGTKTKTMKTKILKYSLLTAILAIAFWSCNKDINPSTANPDLNLSEVQVDIFKHIFSFKKTQLNSDTAKLELNNFSEVVLEEIKEFQIENQYESAGISLIFNYNFNGNLMASLNENDTEESGFFEYVVDLNSPEDIDWKHKKKCRSKDCVGEFIGEMMQKYDGCAQFKIVQHTFSATVYAAPC
jgi:hypothetical protein